MHCEFSTRFVSVLALGDFRDCCWFAPGPLRRGAFVSARGLVTRVFPKLAALTFGCDGTTRTEQGGCRTTFSAMLPIKTCSKPVNPCVEVMITSTLCSYAKA